MKNRPRMGNEYSNGRLAIREFVVKIRGWSLGVSLRETIRLMGEVDEVIEIHGEDPSTGLRAGFPGETFRVLKEKEVRLYGDALRRTRRLASEANGGVG